MNLNSSEDNLVIITPKVKLIIFYKIYWRIIWFLAIPILLLPIYFIGENNAYPSFYVFLVTAAYWTIDAAHPAVISLAALALSSAFALFGVEIITSVIYVTKALLDCLGILLLNVAIEYSNVHKRVALKILLVFGCSHYRLSFLLFYSTMVLSMWISNVITCGLMIPLLRSILMELEKLGIIEVYEVINKDRRSAETRKPTTFTSFYFLGIAYSSSIGGMATMFGSRTNQIFKIIFETMFPIGPKIEFPHFMLLNLPAVLLLETLVYLWLNFYFLGMFRSYHDAPQQMSMTEEETQYINTLLAARYQQIGKLTFHETIVFAVVALTAILHIASNSLYTAFPNHQTVISHARLSAPSMLCVVLLFITPINLDFVKYFKRRAGNSGLLPTAPSKTCLNWTLVKDSIPWSVLFVIGGSNTVFEALKLSKMTQEFEKFLLMFSNWPAPALVLIVILLSKTLTEFTCNSCVAHAILPHIARVCVVSKMNPQYLMLAATLSASLPFHLMTGTPANAMVLAYVHIPPRNMLRAGVVPTVISVATIWFTVTIWSKVIWADINVYSEWANINVLE